MEINNEEKVSIWDINSIINYIRNHLLQFFLLILVFIVIYVVDHITNLNAVLYGTQQAIPGLTNNSVTKKNANKKKTKKI
jgi:hypothetical protein